MYSSERPYFAILFLSLLLAFSGISCKEVKENLPKTPDVNLDILKDEATALISDQLKIPIGKPVRLTIPLDDFCKFLGNPDQDCRLQDYKMKFDQFRIYYAIENFLPAVVLTRTNGQGIESMGEGDDTGFLMASVNKDLKFIPTQSISEEKAKSAVSKFRKAFSGGIKLWDFDFSVLLTLFATLPQDVPAGYERQRNYFDINFMLDKSKNLSISFTTRLGNSVIAEITPKIVYPAWLAPCPPNCSNDKNYFVPIN